MLNIDSELFRKRFDEVCSLVDAEECASRQKRLQSSTDALTPVLRTALVINWKEALMEKRYEFFREHHPEIESLANLKGAIDSTEAIQFCKAYLDLNASSASNPKYRLLSSLTSAFLDYQRLHSLPTEIGALRHWASQEQVLDNMKTDPIGSLYGVGPGVVENLRLCLGYSVIKPDRHVIGVLQQIFKVKINPKDYLSLSAHVGIDPYLLDQVLFRYGQAMKISA